MGIYHSTRRGLVCGAVVSLAAALSSCASPPAGTAQTSLTITIKADGSKVSAQHTLECSGDQALEASTLPSADQACAALNQQPAIVTPSLDPAAACTEIYGGPQRAEVSGLLAGEPIQSEFSRSNGCLISQWEQAELLLDSGL
ncbi:hypothetical protein OF385_01765 [Glutamicibacter sp. JL.03c]|uniref:hypothetical protein n=1 Tax=Glutamicibacter sp. JL.03c TaxID=2984842 RepID=UPI0021F6E446|nr:hypothetical protein [Glutamicibacter sp. JL.03c]UYQ77928.1 hypothetical protein OF385_01765 [Glutamicibacter sp. JL.03c]